jgi:nucleoside-diphosphate-sugar epimerase
MISDWDDAKILIVGGAGFVGSNLTKHLLHENVKEILIIDNLLSSELENIPTSERVTFWQGSITDESILEKLTDDFDYIFHLATYHGNQSSIHNPIADHENNLLSTLKLFNLLKKFDGVKKVVYSGAGCAVAEKTFDDASATKEDDPISLEMDSPYSISKIVGEFYAVYFHKQHRLPAVRARFQNVYGPVEILGAGKWRGTPATVWRNVTPTFIYKAIKQQPLPVENEGVATRDFIYVDDICRGLMACALKGKPGDVYNLASGQETSILELSKTINLLTQNPAGIEFLPKRSWDNSGRRFGSTAKASKELDFHAGTSLSEGLKETIDWTRQNMPLIDACIAKHAIYLKS